MAAGLEQHLPEGDLFPETSVVIEIGFTTEVLGNGNSLSSSSSDPATDPNPCLEIDNDPDRDCPSEDENEDDEDEVRCNIFSFLTPRLQAV